MKIGLRGGHSPNCKGAMGLLDEQTEVRKIYNELVPMLQAAGHVVVDCNSNASNVSSELYEGTNKANAAGCDIFVSLHMNASNGAGNGTECWLYNGSNSTMNGMADKINGNFAAKGFQNRGRKHSTNYHDLNATIMPAMIFESLFCDNAYDVNLYRQLGVKGVASLIANGIVGTAISTGGGGSITHPTAPANPHTALKDLGQVDVYYRAYTDRWWPEVKNREDWAGAGDGIPIKAFMARVSKGSIKYRAHSKTNGWLGWVDGYNENDYNNGLAGDYTDIDAIVLYFYTPTGYLYKRAVYKVSDLSSNNYYPEQHDDETINNQDGYAGVLGIAIDKLQIWVE